MANNIKPVLDEKSFPFDQVVEAYHYLLQQNHVGAAVVDVFQPLGAAWRTPARGYDRGETEHDMGKMKTMKNMEMAGSCISWRESDSESLGDCRPLSGGKEGPEMVG